MINIQCSNCRAVYTLNDDFDGKKGKCKCGTILNIKKDNSNLTKKRTIYKNIVNTFVFPLGFYILYKFYVQLNYMYSVYYASTICKPIPDYQGQWFGDGYVCTIKGYESLAGTYDGFIFSIGVTMGISAVAYGIFIILFFLVTILIWGYIIWQSISYIRNYKKNINKII